MLPAVPRRLIPLITIIIVLSFLYITNPPGTSGPLTRLAPLWRPRYQWRSYKEIFPLEEYTPLPSSAPRNIPAIQADFPPESSAERRVRLERLEDIKKEFEHAWAGYKRYAWLRDEVAPLSGRSNDVFGGWAATLIDSLDTLWIMGMTNEFGRAVKALRKITFSSSSSERVSIFETNIRYLGGLLAAHDLSGGEYPIILQKAIEVGDMLYAAFDTPYRMPVPYWFWSQARRGFMQDAPRAASLAEYGSFSLEFTRLSQVTGDPKYFDAANRLMEQFATAQDESMIPGLWPNMVAISDRIYAGYSFVFSLGAMADSAYEYLPKEYLLLGGRDGKYKTMYEAALEAAKEHLIYRPLAPNNTDILLTGSASIWSNVSAVTSTGEMQHLTCFVGGMAALAARAFARADDMDLAAQLTQGCVWSYEVMPHGVGPEVFTLQRCNASIAERDHPECRWKQSMDTRAGHHPKGFTSISDPQYKLRPEAIESVFVMWRTTGDEAWREKGWRMFEAVRKATRTKIAHAAIQDVTVLDIKLNDKMESFWLGETLKYFYLLFAEPDVVSLDRYVLNTEAHPLIWRSTA